MSYQSLYRKYRPSSFADVVGQQNIITTLENTIKNQKIGHAYIFSGPRGCGKTSIAKIFARKVNCTCDDNTCNTCQMFDNGAEISDVWEIDAASNNGVDEVRRIVENVSYMPMDLKYKVYIIDEVHMLSKAAFNALLKTLEEPPEHVIFILATTEIYKIPLTVLSRCQRFDFKRIEIVDIVERLKYVLDAETITYDEMALTKVAKLADGAMRDALSIIEKVKSYNSEISIEAVNSSLQLVGQDEMNNLIDKLITGDLNQVVNYWQEILSQGIDENKFILDMQYFIRDLLLKQDHDYSSKQLIYFLKTFSELDAKLQFTNNYSLLIEVYLIEMAAMNEQKPVVVASATETYKKESVVSEPVNNVSHQEKLKRQGRELLKASNPSIEEQSDSRPTDVIDFLIGEEEKVNQVKQAKTVAPTIKEPEATTNNLNKMNNEENSCIILDVLCKATVQEKKQLLALYPEMKNKLELEGKYGIAKFFEYSSLQAASELGYVITIDANYIESYRKRIDEINAIFYNYTGKKGKIFLLEVNEWLTKRPEYIARIKELKEKDIFQKAQEEFGIDRVVKI